MAHPATAFHVMIASPSDVPEARDAVQRALLQWNETNSVSRQIVLVPRRWETGAVPMLGSHPQAIINNQLLAQCDCVIAIFGNRLGKATPNAVSGTADEIQEALRGGKNVHLFFSQAPRPHDVELEQLAALEDFRREIEQRGLYGTYNSPEELIAKVWQAIELDLESVTDASPGPRAGVDLIIVPSQDQKVRMDSRGNPYVTTSRYLSVHNRGSKDALDVRFKSSTTGYTIISPTRPATIHAGRTEIVAYAAPLRGEGWVISVQWFDGERDAAKEYRLP